MHFSKLDAYFHLSIHGDKEAYELLYKEYISMAKAEIKSTMHDFSNLAVIPEDFSEYIDFLFFKIINLYDQDRGSFSWFASYVLSNKLNYKVMRKVIDTQNRKVTLDVEENNTILLADNMADPRQVSIVSDIAISNFKYRIASPSKDENRLKSLERKILLLQYAGFNNSEICKKLKLTMGDLRGIIKRVQNKNDLINLKLDLK